VAVPEVVLNRNFGVGSSRSPTAFDVLWVHAVIASNKAFIRTSGASMRRIDKLTVPNSKSPTWIVLITELPMIFNLGILLVQFIRSSFCVALGETIGREGRGTLKCHSVVSLNEVTKAPGDTITSDRLLFPLNAARTTLTV